MNNIAFFLQNNYVERLTVPVAEYANLNKYNIIDRSSTVEFNPDTSEIDFSIYSKILIFGSVQFMHQCINSSLKAFVFYSRDAFNSEKWNSILGNNLLNHDGFICSTDEVKYYLTDTKMHIRPLDLDKAFVGKVYNLNEWMLVNVKNYSNDENIRCWLSLPKEIKSEYRCWVINGKLVEISQYRLDDKPYRLRILDSDLFKDFQQLSDLYHPAECFVIDIADTNSGYKIIEYNPIHGSGWYAADVNNILFEYVNYLSRI